MHGEVRRADRGDAGPASAILADAFTDYAWTRWTVDADEHGERIRALQRLAIERLALPYGEVWVGFDSADLVSVSVWMLPTSAIPDPVMRAMATEQAALEGRRHDASVGAEDFVAPLRPSTPHYYLGAVGVRRDRQRRGFGAVVLAPVLERARSEGVPVFLETSAPENVAFYERLGFQTVAEVEVPGGGPPVWAMSR